MFEVETGIPIPDQSQLSGGRVVKYGFHRLDVGQSIFVPGQGTDGSAAVSARDYGRRHGASFLTRAVDGGVRIWRKS